MTDKARSDENRASTRELNKREAEKLQAGDLHYLAYVGPPQQYDLMGATQFRLLTTLGLRACHRVLDIGCGSLRAGRLLIPYLDIGGYVGVEPNRWLIDDAIQREVGRDLVLLKKPEFHELSDFKFRQVTTGKFDYILAQSILSHTGHNLVEVFLLEAKKVLHDEGLMVVTFVCGDRDFAGDGWIYPGVVTYRSETIADMIERHAMFGTAIPWYHPRQTWYVISPSQRKIDYIGNYRHLLSGPVLLVEQFSGSLAEFPS